MRKILQFLAARVRTVEWGLWLAVALALIAAGPFLARPGLPRQTDAELHVYRAAELGHTLRNGALYPRWAPDLYYGYGYPIFNYYAPLTYYLANLFDIVPGVDIVAGVNVIGRPQRNNGSGARTTDLLSGAMQIQQQKIAELQRKSLRCDIWIEPAISQFRIHDFFHFEAIMSAAKPARDEFKRSLELALNR